MICNGMELMICITIVISTNPNNTLANGNALKIYCINKIKMIQLYLAVKITLTRLVFQT